MNVEGFNKKFLVTTLCAVALALTVTLCVLAFLQRDIPDALNNLTIAAVTGLLGLLGATRLLGSPTGTAAEPIKAEVVNSAAAPVPTTEANNPQQPTPSGLSEFPADVPVPRSVGVRPDATPIYPVELENSEVGFDDPVVPGPALESE